MSTEIIRIENLKKEYGDVTPVKDLSTVINKGDVIAIIGPSGTGKSTFMRCINLLEKPTSGRIFIDGEEITAEGADVTAIRRKMGMVFQNFNLFNNFSVIENVMMAPIDQLGLSKQAAYDKAMELLELVGMADKAYQYPRTLSGGQKQRVAIARALAMDPEILLMDEPTSALDPARVEEVMAVICRLANKGMTMILVTHEMNFARNTANRIIYMDEGGIYEDGTPEEVLEHPKKEKTRLFVFHQQMTVFTVASPLFDYYEALGLLGRFCKSNRISHRLQQRVELILEEIIVNRILPNMKNATRTLPEFKFTLFCEDHKKVLVSVTYPEWVGAFVDKRDDITGAIITRIPNEVRTETDGSNRTTYLTFEDASR